MPVLPATTPAASAGSHSQLPPAKTLPGKPPDCHSQCQKRTAVSERAIAGSSPAPQPAPPETSRRTTWTPRSKRRETGKSPDPDRPPQKCSPPTRPASKEFPPGQNWRPETHRPAESGCACALLPAAPDRLSTTDRPA